MGAHPSVDLFDQSGLIDDAGYDAQVVNILHFYTWSIRCFVHAPQNTSPAKRTCGMWDARYTPPISRLCTLTLRHPWESRMTVGSGRSVPPWAPCSRGPLPMGPYNSGKAMSFYGFFQLANQPTSRNRPSQKFALRAVTKGCRSPHPPRAPLYL